jgi:hypothetical protein
MNLEQLNAIVGAFTLLLIGTASIAALGQLRHAAGANTLSGLLEILGEWQSSEFQQDLDFIRKDLHKLLEDPAFRNGLKDPIPDHSLHRELRVCHWYEQVGSYLKYGLLNDRAYLDVNCSHVLRAWHACWPVIEIMRETRGDALYENFEYAAVRGRLFMEQYPNGTYPPRFPRMRDFGEGAFPKPTGIAAALPPES